MKQARYTEEFKQDSVRQITDKGHPVAEVSERLGVLLQPVSVDEEIRIGQERDRDESGEPG